MEMKFNTYMTCGEFLISRISFFSESESSGSLSASLPEFRPALLLVLRSPPLELLLLPPRVGRGEERCGVVRSE